MFMLFWGILFCNILIRVPYFSGRKPKLPPGKTVEVCQKAFMNMYSITEKRIRLQRERLITKSRFEAEEKRIEAEEMKTSVSVAKDLVASFRPLLMSQSDNAPITTLPSQLLSSIDHDITVVNNFFRNQLWKPEYMMAGKSHVPPGQLSLELGLDYEWENSFIENDYGLFWA